MFLAPNCPQHDGSTSPIETKAHGFLCGIWQMKSPWEELEGTWPPQIGFPPPNWWVWLASCANTFRDKSATFLPLPKGMHKMLQTAVITCMTDPMFGCGRSDRLIKRLRMFIHVYPCSSNDPWIPIELSTELASAAPQVEDVVPVHVVFPIGLSLIHFCTLPGLRSWYVMVD